MISKELKEKCRQLEEKLASMTKEERLAWFTDSPELNIRFTRDIDGTIYIARAFFDPGAKESVAEKTERLLLKQSEIHNCAVEDSVRIW